MVDRATILGLLATLALIGCVIAEGSSGLGPKAFWHGSAAALVVGGAALTTLIAFPWSRFWSAGRIASKALIGRASRPEELIAVIVSLAHVARKDGLLALEQRTEALKDDFLKRAMRMAVDGVDAHTIEQICRVELESLDARHATGSALFESFGRAAPVFGMMGTVIGLVIMLGRLNDPTQIGPGMSAALLATLYGLIVANVFCLPIARKLTHRSSEELLGKTISLAGVLAIQAGDNPRVVEQKLRAFLPARTAVPPVPVTLPVAATVPTPAKKRFTPAARLRALLGAFKKLTMRAIPGRRPAPAEAAARKPDKLMEAA